MKIRAFTPRLAGDGPNAPEKIPAAGLTGMSRPFIMPAWDEGSRLAAKPNTLWKHTRNRLTSVLCDPAQAV